MLKRNPCLKHCRMLLKIWKKYWLITAHLNFNFWYCKPILKAIQGQKLEISCSKHTCSLFRRNSTEQLTQSPTPLLLFSSLLCCFFQQNSTHTRGLFSLALYCGSVLEKIESRATFTFRRRTLVEKRKAVAAARCW